jgi:hypothetical protein
MPIQERATPEWIQQNYSYCSAAMIGSVVAVFAVACCAPQLGRKFPYNYIFLFFVTICESIMVGFISGMYTTQSVVLAAGLTASIFVGLTVYAFTTKSDFTGFGGYLLCMLLGLLAVSLLSIILPIPQCLMAGAGAVLFSFYIVYDTQLIMGGKHACKIDIDDYAFAALNIYLDIINLFLYILECIGDRSN